MSIVNPKRDEESLPMRVLPQWVRRHDGAMTRELSLRPGEHGLA
jgi:hypothetical protein